jgi:hypothetical protein
MAPGLLESIRQPGRFSHGHISLSRSVIPMTDEMQQT